MNHKQKFGQFFTTNYNHILQSLSIPSNVNHIIEPFAGNKDLIKYLDENYPNREFKIDCYDIDPKHDDIIMRDTLKDPPNFTGTYVLSNPPYLARNKSKDKTLYDQYNTNDLYKCFIKILISSPCLGGIIIIPLNFLSSIRKCDIDLRKRFVELYHIEIVNIFEEKVFEDTSYTVCSIQFNFKENNDENKTKFQIYPSNKLIETRLEETNNYTIGGGVYNLRKSDTYKVDRATKLTKNKDTISNILLKCLDDSPQNMIQLRIVDDETKDKYVDRTDKLSARSYATLVITPKLDKETSEILVKKFNDYLNTEREKYHSLFLSNYRESKEIARKRISFKFAFDLCSHLLSD
tara:strand:+ start:187 stop:1233 length:1047 start_codon:yes stop_codon:yes gene_type:complete